MKQRTGHVRGTNLLAAMMTMCFAVAGTASAELKMPALFGDNMVLQREARVPVWGTAAPGSPITVALDGVSRRAVADREGRWRVTFPRHAAGGPVELAVCGDGEVRLRNVMFGEVWICSGQSNMELPLSAVNNATAEIEAANDPGIRLFTVEKAAERMPQRDCRGTWTPCRPAAAASFSAVGYFFGRKLRQELGVTVGLINSSWGGTPAESWTPLAAMGRDPALRSVYARGHELLATKPKTGEAYTAELAAWEKATYLPDPGVSAAARGWEQPDASMDGWGAFTVPGYWEQELKTNFDGAVWFRKDIEIPASWAGWDLTLHLGTIDDFDTTYFNGRQVGATPSGTPGGYGVQRHYAIPGALVKAGRAVLAVRVFDHWGDGGLGLNTAGLSVTAPVGVTPSSLPLGESWKYRVELALPPRPSGPMPRMPSDAYVPSVLFNGMIRPLIPYAIRGAIWYQGESNANRADEYRTLFPTMIDAWRRAWGEGEFPFYFVQLANFMGRTEAPGESDWAELRDAQLETLALPHSGMAVIIDIGDALDIHPRNKQDVGLRLAFHALAHDYGRKIPYSGPIFRSMTIKGDRAYLAFDHTEGGLKAGGDDGLKGFAIAGADGRFVWAEAAIEGDRVVVSSPEVKAPIAVRYGWASNPLCTLYNGAGLPASPFRTDAWERRRP